MIGSTAVLWEVVKGAAGEAGKDLWRVLTDDDDAKPSTYPEAEAKATEAIEQVVASGASIAALTEVARLELSTLEGLRQRVHLVCTTTGCAPHREKGWLEFVDGIEKLAAEGRHEDARKPTSA